jgi:hypothetical protein
MLDTVVVGDKAERLVSRALDGWGITHTRVYGVKWWLSKEPLNNLNPMQRRWVHSARSMFSADEHSIRSLFTDFENLLYETNRKPRFNATSRTSLFRDELGTHPKQLTASRYPDFMGRFPDGRLVFIEVKNRHSNLSHDQRTFMKIAKERGFRTLLFQLRV